MICDDCLCIAVLKLRATLELLYSQAQQGKMRKAKIELLGQLAHKVCVPLMNANALLIS